MSFIKIITLIFIYSLSVNSAISQENDLLKKDSLPAVRFKKNSYSLTIKNKQTLDTIIKVAAQYPALAICILGELVVCNLNYNNISWDRKNAVVNYFVLKGIKKERLIFSYSSGEYGVIGFKLDSIDISKTDPPHPNLMKKKNK